MRRRIIAGALALALTGCSALGERQVTIDADADVRVLEGNRPVCAGRHMIPTLQADDVRTLTLVAEGYEIQRVTFTPHTQGGDVAAFLLKCVILPPALLLFPFVLSAGGFAQFSPNKATVHMVPTIGATK